MADAADRPIADGIVLRICRGLSCSRHSEAIERAAREAIAKSKVEGEVGVLHESCFGRCFAGPNVLIERWRRGRANEQAMIALMMNQPHPAMSFEQGVAAEDVRGIIRRHLRADRKARDDEGA
jgi:(2Fe-2S) ferredoxin